MRALCSLDCILPSWGINMFGTPRETDVGCFTHCPGSVGPSGARKVQAQLKPVRLDHLGFTLLASLENPGPG